MSQEIQKIVSVLREGGVIVYPTEGVYGFGCDPFNLTAVTRLLKIKGRSFNKGLILIASSWHQVEDLVRTDLEKCYLIKPHRDHPVTWVFPATKKVPCWIRGQFNSVAIRVTFHQVTKKICQKFGGPIVSTSANLADHPPLNTFKQVASCFISKVDYVVKGRVGKLGRATKICEVKTGKIIRA